MSIKNGDLPAMPTIYADMATNGQREIYCDQTGLSKREQFAMTAMQGLISSGMDWTLFDHRDVSEQAVIMADALLAELEKSK